MLGDYGSNLLSPAPVGDRRPPGGVRSPGAGGSRFPERPSELKRRRLPTVEPVDLHRPPSLLPRLQPEPTDQRPVVERTHLLQVLDDLVTPRLVQTQVQLLQQHVLVPELYLRRPPILQEHPGLLPQEVVLLLQCVLREPGDDQVDVVLDEAHRPVEVQPGVQGRGTGARGGHPFLSVRTQSTDRVSLVPRPRPTPSCSVSRSLDWGVSRPRGRRVMCRVFGCYGWCTSASCAQWSDS